MGMFPTTKEDQKNRVEELLEELEHPEDFLCRGKGFTGVLKKYIEDQLNKEHLQQPDNTAGNDETSK